MIYGIGYREFNKETGHQFTIQKHISQEEYENHANLLGETKKINAMTNVFKLLQSNAHDYLAYSSNIKKHLDANKNNVYHESNRLLINYLSSLSMFIDYGERYNKKHFGKASMEKFQKKQNEFYDGHVSYRFMAIMRNYALHYGFPLSVINRNISGSAGIYASKEALLQFKKWKHAREDIEKMPEKISLEIHVEISLLFLKNLYEDFVYQIAPSVIKGVEYLNGLIKENGGNIPLFVKFKSIDELKKGNINVSLPDPDEYMSALEIIKSHPSIKIEIK